YPPSIASPGLPGWQLASCAVSIGIEVFDVLEMLAHTTHTRSSLQTPVPTFTFTTFFAAVPFDTVAWSRFVELTVAPSHVIAFAPACVLGVMVAVRVTTSELAPFGVTKCMILE